MKQFLKMTLAVVCGIFVTTIIGFMLLSAFVGAVAASGSGTPVLPRSGVLNVDMSAFTLGEQSTDMGSFDVTSLIAGASGPSKTIGIYDAVRALNAASVDPSVKFLFLRTDNMASDITSLEEFRVALANFRQHGKAIVSYVESPSTGGYYLASVADKIYMTSHHGGNPTFVGVGGTLYFLKDILDKLGVNVQLIRHGKYKSAGEMYIKNQASPENMEQNTEMITSIWGKLREDICASREITAEDLDAMLNDLKLNSPEDFLNNKLVDLLVTKEELKDRIAALAVASKYDDVKFINFADYVTVKVTDNIKAKQKIAVIYANGEIVDGNSKQEVAGDYFASQIAKVRADENVKVVVLRVNSPGGSVIASDKIKAEIDLLRQEKPVIGSYGSYAASGGYWISNSCDRIFADATTLTGSIGVFSMIPDVSKTVKNLAHITVTSVNSHKHTDMYSLMRPLDKDELDYMQASVEDIYSQFVNVVSEGRDLEPSYVDDIAQGRVWTGAEGLRIGLVDEIGTLEDAIKYAASLVSGSDDLSSWNVASYPKPQTQMEMLLEMLSPGSTETLLEGTPFEVVGKELNSIMKSKGQSLTLARMPYSIDIR